MYDEAFAKGGALPDEVDRQSLFAVAAMLGRNRPEVREPWPENAPDIRTVRRNHARNRDLPVPGRDDPIGDDEYRELLALVTPKKGPGRG